MGRAGLSKWLSQPVPLEAAVVNPGMGLLEAGRKVGLGVISQRVASMGN